MKPTGLLRVAALALIWGSGFLLIKVSLGGFSPLQLTFSRLALGAITLVIIVYATRRKLPPGHGIWRHLVVAALLANALPYALFGYAETTVPSNLAGAINATTPLWTVLLAALFARGDRPRALQWVGVLVGLVGALLILSPWQTNGPDPIGVICCLAASASYGASYLYMARHLTNRGLPPIVLSAAQLIAASGILFITLPIGGRQTMTLSPAPLFALLTLGIIGTGVAYVLNYRIISDDGPILASTVTYLLPVVAVVLGALVLGEPFTVQLAVGVLVVLAGVAITRRAKSDTHRPLLKSRVIDATSEPATYQPDLEGSNQTALLNSPRQAPVPRTTTGTYLSPASQPGTPQKQHLA